MIERAKGVIAHEEQLSMEAAFERLLELSEARGEPLGQTALRVVDRARDGGPHPSMTSRPGTAPGSSPLESASVRRADVERAVGVLMVTEACGSRSR